MTNATKTLLVLFVSLLAVTVLVRWTQSPSASEAFQGPLLTVDSTSVAGLSIRAQTPASALQVTRRDTGWTVQPSDTSATYAADVTTVENAISALLALRPEAVVTRQEAKHARYGVDSTGTQVVVQNDEGEPLHTVIVGRSQPGGRGSGPTTYVRIEGRPDVYSVSQPLSVSLPTSPTRWRNKQVWRLDRSRIARVDFDYPADSSFTIRRAADGNEWVSRGDTLRSGSVSSLLRPLSSLDARGFAEERTPPQIAPRYTLRLHLDDGSTRAVRLQPDGSGSYLVAASDYPYVFTVSKNRWDRSVLQARGDLLRPSTSASPTPSSDRP